MNDNQQIVMFNIGNEFLGASIKEVNEIIKIEKITKIPRMPAYVEGVINIRDKLCTIINLRARLGYEKKEVDENTKIIVIGEGRIGFIVDNVSEIITINDENIHSPEEIFSMSIKSIQFIVKIKDKIVAVLNIPELSIISEDVEIDFSFEEELRA